MDGKPVNDIYFVSSNINKYNEVKTILDHYGIVSHFCKMGIREIQSESVYEIAEAKSKYAFEQLQKPVIVEDDGFYIRSLSGFPGQYSSFVYKTLGNQGILKLMKNRVDRRAYFLSVIVYNDGYVFKRFSGKTSGKLNKMAIKGGWGFDPIFIPRNAEQSYAELSLLSKKSIFSHRSKSLKKFSKWYLSYTTLS